MNTLYKLTKTSACKIHLPANLPVKIKSLCRNPVFRIRNQRYINLLVIKHSSQPSIRANHEDSSDFHDEDLSGTDEINIKSNYEKYRELLYPKSSDDTIQKLNMCSSVESVFRIIEENSGSFNATHASQAVLILWDLQRNYYKVNSMVMVEVNPQDTIEKYIEEVTSHATFKKLTEIVDEKYLEMSTNALTCTLLYLCKMGVSLRHETMQKLIRQCQREISTTNLTLDSISRFLVAIYKEKGLYATLISVPVLPLVLNALDKCDNPEDFRLITISLNCMHHLLGNDLLMHYKNKLEILLSDNIITTDSYKTTIKIIQFLNFPHWSQNNTLVIRKCVLLLQGSIPKLELRELISLHKVFITHLETRELLTEIQEHALKSLSSEETNPSSHNSPELLACIVPFSSPAKRRIFENIARNYIKQGLLPSSVAPVFKILRHVKTGDFTVCHSFWTQTLRILRSDPKERVDYKLLRICHKYMHFNNNLAGTYRHYDFEAQMMRWLLDEVTEGLAGMIPAKFSRVMQFLIAYGFSNNTKINITPELRGLKLKLTEMRSQFSAIDCSNLARGLQIATDLQNKRHLPPLFADYFHVVHHLLDVRSVELLRENLSMMQINYLMKSYVSRNAPLNVPLFGEMVQKYVEVQRRNDISSRLVRDAVYMCQTTNCLVPEIMERLTGFVIDRKETLIGDTVEKVLYLCYHLGYTPHRSEEFLDIAADILSQERNRMTGLSILQASLALGYFQRLPLSMIQFIFTEQFLEQIDEEIKMCYSKAVYPVRIRSSLMQLNRTVCMDYPEANVPWFHQKYCDDIKNAAQSHQRNTLCSVLTNLSEVVGGRQKVKVDSFTPYNYKIDYLVELDHLMKPIEPDEVSREHTSKIAFLVLNPNAMTTINTNIKGTYQLKHRHMEMLGYRVVFINPFIWNSIYLNGTDLRQDYLRNHVWPAKT